MSRHLLPGAVFLILFACAPEQPALPAGDQASGLRAAEEAFAGSMADRDLDAFATFVSDEAVFLNGGRPLRGKKAVLEHWTEYFQGPDAPFSWRPELAEVALTGDLGYTEGPVLAPSGEQVATFYTMWRRGGDGRWRVVFDNGYEVCPCAEE